MELGNVDEGKDWCIPQHAFHSFTCSSSNRLRNSSRWGITKILVQQSSHKHRRSAPAAVRSLSVFQWLIVFGKFSTIGVVLLFPNAAQKTKSIEEKPDWNIRSLFLVGKEGRWRREREGRTALYRCLPLGSPRCFWALILSFVVSKTSRVVYVYHTFQPSTRGLCGAAQVSSGKKDLSSVKAKFSDGARVDVC